MSKTPDDLLYSEEHEYLKATGEEGEYFVGITDYAQGELGDIVYVELPEAGDRFERGDTFGTVEAVKAVSDLYSPVSGEVVEVNDALNDDPSPAVQVRAAVVYNQVIEGVLAMTGYHAWRRTVSRRPQMVWNCACWPGCSLPKKPNSSRPTRPGSWKATRMPCWRRRDG